MKVKEEKFLNEVRTVKSTIDNILDKVIAEENRTLSERAEIKKAEQKLMDQKESGKQRSLLSKKYEGTNSIRLMHAQRQATHLAEALA